MKGREGEGEKVGGEGEGRRGVEVGYGIRTRENRGKWPSTAV